MTIIFDVKSDEIHSIKILTILLSNNIKTGSFEINTRGIFLKSVNQNRSILIDLSLFSENFEKYYVDPKFADGGLFIALNLGHLTKMLKYTKKKDSIQMLIDDENPTELCIRIFPRENNRITTSYIKIQNTQNVEIEIPDLYDDFIVLNSIEYHKMCKDLSMIGNSVRITVNKTQIQFRCNAGGVIKRIVNFGENLTDDSISDIIFEQDFASDQLCHISRLAGLSKTLNVYTDGDEKPLMFYSKIGNMGNISIFVKTKDQTEHDNCI